jgi:methylenetetrahydrofolate--tRNA-(uracil-5-)-methyltransferase
VKAGKGLFFEGCLPIEILAARGMDALAFGPLRPIGLTDPRTGRRPWAVLQLRLEDNFASAYNMVGFQTNLRYPEQDRVFRLIPGLAEASFLRYGQMHRNSYINAPAQLNQFLQLKSHPNVFIAGQLSGIEGYMGNIASGLMSGMNAASYLKREPYLQLPEETMIASLIRSITSADPESFQPIKANMGILPALKELVKRKTDRAHKLSQRSLIALKTFLLKNSAKMDPVEQ